VSVFAAEIVQTWTRVDGLPAVRQIACGFKQEYIGYAGATMQTGDENLQFVVKYEVFSIVFLVIPV
jgi:hypothetical protein